MIGINGQIGPHTLRHTFASHLLQAERFEGDPGTVGHSSLSTTQKYTHIDITHLMDVYDKAHPSQMTKKIKIR
jgi:integrase/recombinase XerC